MLTKNIAEMTAKINAHAAADLIVQGNYYNAETGKGCFIGCLTHGSNVALIADEYGIPPMLTRVLERIFESLPMSDAKEFFREIPVAIGSNGKDLTCVVWAFLAETLRNLPMQTPEIQTVIDGLELLAEGKPWTAEAAEAAAWTAEAVEAAWAARAARAAVEAAEWAAQAVGLKETQRQRDSILRLMRNAK